MISYIKNRLSIYLKRDNELSQKILKNIFLSFGVKGGSILVGLALIPMTISYIDSVQYGIWLTISSIVNWMSFFDIGLGHGLRNKLAAALALEKYDDAKKYVSTTYAILLLIGACVFLAFCFVNPLIEWRKLLNIPTDVNANMTMIMLMVVGAFCIQFVVQLINIVLTAIHEPAKAGVITFFGQLLMLITIYILKLTTPGSLIILVTTLTSIPLLVLIVSSLVMYRTKLNRLAPAVRYVDFRYVKDILNIGGAFFFIQIGALVLFQTDNIIITKVIGPQAVTEFNIAYKLFTVVTMVFTIIITPYWSAFTNANAKSDFEWMRKNINLMRKIWALLSLATVILYFLSPFLYRIWIGKQVTIDRSLSLAMALYLIVNMWQTLHVYFLNGIGKVRLQLILVTISAFANIPMAVFLGKRIGMPGIVSANTIAFIIMSVFFTIQTEMILKRKEKGIWAR